MTHPTTIDPFDDSGPRTLAWYACHDFYEDGRVYSHRPEQGFVNAPAVTSKLALLAQAGLHDLVPNAENMRPLFTEHAAVKGTVREVLHWVFATMLRDPSLDPAVLRLVFELAPGGQAIALVSNPNCPDEIRDFYLKVSGTKNDPTKTTKGGEVVVFFLHDRTLPGRYVDLVARSCRKAGTQESAALHANASRETLAWIVRNGKSDAVKRTALWTMHLRGMLTV